MYPAPPVTKIDVIVYSAARPTSTSSCSDALAFTGASTKAWRGSGRGRLFPELAPLSPSMISFEAAGRRDAILSQRFASSRRTALRRAFADASNYSMRSSLPMSRPFRRLRSLSTRVPAVSSPAFPSIAVAPFRYWQKQQSLFPRIAAAPQLKQMFLFRIIAAT